MGSEYEKQLCVRMVEAQARLEQVREQIRETGVPMTEEQRDRLDQAKLYFQTVKVEFDAVLGDQLEVLAV